MKKLLDFNPNLYDPLFAGLLQEERLSPLDAGTSNHTVKSTLANLKIENAFLPHQIRDPDMARLPGGNLALS